jgi:proteasome lid subunit RPN8/RPN11
MSQSTGERETVTWSVPQCPFTIEASARVLDDIRLAVVDAFFSLPRGGAEIGGILLGKFTGDRLTITDYAALECEHAHGPSFTLSEPDEKRLVDLLSIHGSFGGGSRPVGWYHSHTRSEIFLSEADLGIHARFFPEAWQVAMVMKPHTFQPARIGFFFREADGSIHATESYQEVTLEGLRVQAMPGPVPTVATTEELPVRRSEPAPAVVAAPVAVPEAAPLPTPPPAPIPQPEPPLPAAAIIGDGSTPPPAKPALPVPARVAAKARDVAPPSFGMEPERTPRNWSWLVIAAVVLGISAGAFQTRQMWMPRVTAAVQPAANGPVLAPSLGLNSIDRNGQLQINWNPNSPAIRRASDAILEITEGTSTPQAIQLDSVHLQAGNFTFAREAEKVDIKLIVHQANGPDVREAIGFLGKPPVRKPAAEDPAELKRREEDQKQAEKLKADLEAQAAKTKKLEKDLVQMKVEMRLQQLRRLNNQVPDKK